MLYGKEGQLLRRSKGEDANMKKINILLCDDDKDFLRRLADFEKIQSSLYYGIPRGVGLFCYGTAKYFAFMT